MTDRNGGAGRLGLPADADTRRDEQVDKALRRLEDRGELTAQQRVAVERLADRLTGELLDMFEVEDRELVDADDEMRGVALCQD